jgi:uncharacterized protein (TIGR02246 family)
MTDDEQEIRKLMDAWMSASQAGDVPAVLDLMTQDVIFMTPGQPPFGRKEFAAISEGMKGATMVGRSEPQEIEVFGDHAFVRNYIQISLARPGGLPKRMSGYAMSILRKEADGRWRLARDANLVLPEPG